ncbi:hypothetical protein ACFQ48_04705 [Hymenobacter caeli]|uniref:Uncharacterized protein n=1 Tax=Hymenobacter caeli TaxID=2735894 RepID=A0ABX2FQ04_9BACT|nr:hypothetical protein [Hymenobacter caeli]NRT19260.1 hypothetical protein [Hymenobacter caeli]
MSKSPKSSQTVASADTNAGFSHSTATRTSPPVATLRQYLDGPAEAFELARRQARAARPAPGGAPDAGARQLFAH